MSQCAGSENSIYFNSVTGREPVLLHAFAYYCALKTLSTKIQQIPKFKGALASSMSYYSVLKIGFSFSFKYNPDRKQTLRAANGKNEN